MPSVLIDVTQWAHWPATTGVQRVLGHLAERWRGDEAEASFGFIDHDAYVVGPIAGFASVVRSRFERGKPGEHWADSAASVARDLRKVGEAIIPADRLAGRFAGYLLPEPTSRAASLSVLASLGPTSSVVPFVLYYDALPVTHPQFFPGGADRSRAVTRYHRAVSRAENVAFISQGTRHVFETRIARRRVPNALVARLGADAFPARRHESPDPPRFTVVGTIEPRKRYALLLDVFERLWAMGRPYELVVLGRAAWEHPVVERLERLSRSQPLQWIHEADDDDVLEALSRSTALLFLSAAEGYGLPPLEALSVGCPVIVSDDLPALEELPPHGQIRLRRMSPQLVHAAVERIADPVLNAQYRLATHAIELPTWERFAGAIEGWIALRLREGRIPLVA